jgi:hypothetical protein
VEVLQISIDGAEQKLTQLEANTAAKAVVHLGIPDVGGAPPVTASATPIPANHYNAPGSSSIMIGK